MWNRKELKLKGKAAFKANYWNSVLVAFIFALVSGGAAGFTGSYSQTLAPALEDMSYEEQMVFLIGFMIIMAAALVVTVLFSIFLGNPLVIGCSSFFLRNRTDASAQANEMGTGFKPNYKNKIWVSFMRDLFIFLWLLLLIIPGIIKAYEYRLVPYILAENPDINYKDALEQSKTAMYGNKWNSFVLDLSFIGWILLGILTLGLLYIFYLYPYVRATDAELYTAIMHPEQACEDPAFADAPKYVDFTVE